MAPVYGSGSIFIYQLVLYCNSVKKMETAKMSNRAVCVEWIWNNPTLDLSC